MDLAVATLNTLALAWLLAQGLGGQTLLARALASRFPAHVPGDRAGDLRKSLDNAVQQAGVRELSEVLEAEQERPASRPQGEPASGPDGWNPDDAGEVLGCYDGLRAGKLKDCAGRNHGQAGFVANVRAERLNGFVEDTENPLGRQLATPDRSVKSDNPGVRVVISGWAEKGADVVR